MKRKSSAFQFTKCRPSGNEFGKTIPSNLVHEQHASGVLLAEARFGGICEMVA
jgi:hypothetical protein